MDKFIRLLLFIIYPYICGMNTYIYALTSPITNEIKYIGKSDNPKTRLYGHIKDSRKKGRKTKKEEFIKNWESAKFAGLSLGLNYKGINNSLRKLSTTSEGFTWKYK